MNLKHIILELRKHFDPASFGWCIAALRQEPLVWESLIDQQQDPSLARLALENLSGQARDWTPAALALIALGSPISLVNLRDSDWVALEPDLRNIADQAYTRWLDRNSDFEWSLGEAGLVALALRERQVFHGNWQFLVELLAGSPPSIRPVLACLVGMIPDWEDFLLTLCQTDSSLGMHAFLSTPLPIEDQVLFLDSMLKKLDGGIRYGILKVLKAIRPELASALSINLSSLISDEQTDLSKFPLRPDKLTATGLNPAVFDKIQQLLQSADALTRQNRPEQAIPIYHQAIQVNRQIQAFLTAQLAKAYSSDYQDSSQIENEDLSDTSINDQSEIALQAWETVISLDPNNVDYISRYAWLLLDRDRLDTAKSILNSVIIDTDPASLESSIPFLYWAAQARIAVQAGDNEQAQDFVHRASKQNTSPFQDNQERIKSARLAIQMGSLEPAIEFSSQVLSAMPNDPVALSLYSQTQLMRDRTEEALDNAVLAYSQQPNLENQRILIQALEANHEWNTALVEQQDLIERLSQPSGEDWRNLARYALQAGQPDLAIDACHECLAIDEHDGLAVELMGDVAQSEGDSGAALGYYQLATQLAPELPTPWISLAYEYQRQGQPNHVLETFRLGSQASPNSPDLQLALGKALLTENSPTLALIPLRQAATLIFNFDHPKFGNRENNNLRHDVANTLGKTMYQLGYLEEARQAFEQVCQLTPESSPIEPDLAFNYAQTLLQLQEVQAALPWLESVIRHSEYPLAKLIYARTILGLTPDSNQIKQAVGLLQQILETDSNNSTNQESVDGSNREPTESKIGPLEPLEYAEAYALLAETLYSIGDFPNALSAYKKALDSALVRQPGWVSRLSNGLGQTAMALGQPETAITAFIEAGQADPNNFMINRCLSEAYAQIELTGDAFQAAIRAVRQDSNNPETLIWFVNQCLFLQEHPTGLSLPIYEYSQQAVDRAIAITPDRAELYVLGARVQIIRGESEKAIAILNQLIDLQASDINLDIECLQQAAEMLRKLGKAQLAAEFLEQALRLVQANDPAVEQSRLMDLHLTLSQTWQEAGNYNAALTEVNKAIGLDGENISGYFQRSSIKLATGELEDAAESLEKAIQLADSSWKTHLQLALIRHALGDLPAALKHAKMAVGNVQATEDLSGYDDGHQSKSDQSNQDSSALAFAHWLAPYLMQSMLVDEKAVEKPDDSPFAESWYEYAFLKAELDLERNDIDAAASAIAAVIDNAQHNPHLLALQARLVGRQEGIGTTSIQLFSSAVDQIIAFHDRPNGSGADLSSESLSSGDYVQRILTQSAFAETFYQVQIEQLEIAATIQGLVKAAIELDQWTALIGLCDRLILVEPNAPATHLLHARAIVVRAEAQRLCENLKIIRHSPGKAVLSEESHNLFEHALLNAAERIDLDSIPVVNQITHWRARGQAVFSTDDEGSAALINYLEQYHDEVENVDLEDRAAMIRSLGQSGQIEAAQEWANYAPYHPLIAVTLALAISREEPEHAILVVQQSLERYANPDLSMLDARPMAQALIAILSNRPGVSFQDLQNGYEAIRSALGVWPDEARWHAIAADLQISLTIQDPTYDDNGIEIELVQAAQLEPDLAEHHLKLGIFYAERGDIDQALIAIEKATQAEPELSDPWLFLASMQKETGQLEKAIFSTERALAFAPQSIDALLLRSELALLTNNPRGALSRTQMIVNITPDQPEAWFIMAQALEVLEQPEEALKAIEKAIPLSDRPISMQQLRVRLLYTLYGPQMAIQAIQLQLEGDQLDPVLNSLLADYWLELGETGNAIQSARRALQTGQVDLPPATQSHLHQMIGVHARHSGQLDQAIYHLNEAIHQTPNNLDAYLELGLTHQDRRQINQALEVYQMAVKIAPNDYRPYYQAGLALKDSKDYLEAETMFRRAAHLAPNELNIHRQLAAVVALNLVHNRRIPA